MILLADNKGPDQTVWMSRLTWALAVRICPKTYFRMAQPVQEVYNYFTSQGSYVHTSGLAVYQNLT